MLLSEHLFKQSSSKSTPFSIFQFFVDLIHLLFCKRILQACNFVMNCKFAHVLHVYFFVCDFFNIDNDNYEGLFVCVCVSLRVCVCVCLCVKSDSVIFVVGASAPGTCLQWGPNLPQGPTTICKGGKPSSGAHNYMLKRGGGKPLRGAKIYVHKGGRQTS